MFEHNEKFAEHFADIIRHKEVVTIIPASEIRRLRAGIKAKLWRWWFGQLNSLHEGFWTMGYDIMAANIECRGWRIWQTPERPSMPISYLHREVAHQLQISIPQLSDQTQINKSFKSSHHVPVVPHDARNMFDVSAPVDAGIKGVDMNVYHINWQEFVFQVASEKYFGQMDAYYFAVAYDPFDDCIYLDYQE